MRCAPAAITARRKPLIWSADNGTDAAPMRRIPRRSQQLASTGRASTVPAPSQTASMAAAERACSMDAASVQSSPATSTASSASRTHRLPASSCVCRAMTARSRPRSRQYSRAAPIRRSAGSPASTTASRVTDRAPLWPVIAWPVAGARGPTRRHRRAGQSSRMLPRRRGHARCRRPPRR